MIMLDAGIPNYSFTGMNMHAAVKHAGIRRKRLYRAVSLADQEREYLNEGASSGDYPERG
jgi:hypothetical protein